METMETTPADIQKDPDRGRVRDLLLRPAAVPLDRLRRPDAAEARGLPGHGPVRGGDPARGRVRRPHLRRLRRQGQADRAHRRRRRPTRRSSSTALRADPDGHAGDPAPEDAARRDLRRADARARNEAEPLPEGGTLPTAQVSDAVQLDEIFRAFDPETRAAFQTWMQGQAAAPARPRRRPLGRDRQPRPVRRAGRPIAATARLPGAAPSRSSSATAATVFDALSERQGQLRGLIENSTRCSRPRRGATRS